MRRVFLLPLIVTLSMGVKLPETGPVPGESPRAETAKGDAVPVPAVSAPAVPVPEARPDAETSTAKPAPGASKEDSGLRTGPSIWPSSLRRIVSADGTRGRPGMVMISPQITTTKPAPGRQPHLAHRHVWPVGAPRRFGSVEKEYCVLAMQTGRLP
jgi:hypothetical protein